MSEDMNELWLKYKETKSVAVRNEIAEKYMVLVRIVCGRLASVLPEHVDKEDLLSSGYFGLLDAIERYEVSRGVKFETYAGVRIRGAMLDYLRELDAVPVSVRQKLRKLEETVKRLENEKGRTASEAEVAQAMGMTEAELSKLIRESALTQAVPLEETAIQIAPAGVEKVELRETLARALERLPARERLVLTLYYYEELTLKEISVVLQLTEARISQIHKQAIIRMRGYVSD